MQPSHPTKLGTLTVLVVVSIVLLTTVACSGTSDRTATARPNILFVLTDDMRLDELQYLPSVLKLIGEQGVTFSNYFDNVTLCCPARATILTGQYSQNTGVQANGGTNGGFETAYASGMERNTIATALHAAGYTTGLFGKYLNGYPNTASSSYVPPGWDRWSSAVKGNAYGEYNYTLNEDGKQVDYGATPADYGTNVYMRQTRDFIASATASHKPFFAYVSVYAPHDPATPAFQDANAFPDLAAPRDPAFNEEDVTDKPAYINDLPPLTAEQEKAIDDLYRNRVRSLQAVDRGVASLVDTLRSSGQLDNTYLVFTSDNGFHLGQHRLPSGKESAYETDVHLPLLVAGPKIAPGTHIDAIAGNVDLGPTMADMGGATMTNNPDGRSLLPFLDPSRGDPGPWRQSYLVQHWDEKDAATTTPRGGSLEPPDADEERPRRSLGAVSVVPPFQALRLEHYMYVEYDTGERELYDVVRDPDELDNIAISAEPAFVDALHTRLTAMKTCAAAQCRSVESAPVPSP